MTISKVLNSCCNCCNYTPKENPIKNAIHTWYLSNGGETHLIRHDDKIELLTIQGKEKTSTFTYLAEILEIYSSPEEFIECTIEMVPVFNATGKLEFIDTKELQLHTWERKYGSPVELFSTVHELYLKIMSDKETVLRKFSSLDGSSLEEQVSWLKESHPHVYGRKDKCFFEFEEKIKEQKSTVDEKIIIDMDHWCVTMFNSDTSGIMEAYLPCTWTGHALLVVETIEEGEYFARQIDLVKDLKGSASIRFFELFPPDVKGYVKDYSKSETHRRPKEDIQRMIDQVFLEVTRQKNKDPLIFFTMRGDNLSFWEKYFSDEKKLLSDEMFLEGLYKNPFNCVKYSNRNLRFANIKPISRSRYMELSNKLLQTPLLYEGSRVKATAQEAFLSLLHMGVQVSLRTTFSLIATFGLGSLSILCGAKDVAPIFVSAESTNAIVRLLMGINEKPLKEQTEDSLISKKDNK